MATFVLEIGSEELPARFLPIQEEELAARFKAALEENVLGCGSLRALSTPRRAIVEILDLDPVQGEREEVVLGPSVRVAYGADGAPTKALEGFVRSGGCALDDVFRQETPKGEYVAIRKRIGGASAKDLLAGICPAVILGQPFAKRMRWGSNTVTYARPLRWIVALLDDEVVPFEVGPVKSGRETFGHRVHGRGPFPVAKAGDLLSVVTELGGVTPAPADRRSVIVKGGDNAASAIGGRVLWKDSLLREVEGLTEHPVPLLGDFDPSFLEVPREVLLTSMESHQKSFGVEGGDGRLMPHFLTVLNMTPPDRDLVKRGWERVLRARLEDARFFWHADLRDTFDRWLEKLDHVIFIGRLGSMGEKTRRLERLCRRLAEKALEEPADGDAAARAGRLSKADLVSGMVGEFDTLQGVMGGIYAERKGEPAAVAAALREQYLPAGPDTPVPDTPLGALLSLADKIDTLAGCFGLGMIPTGAADPNALRRCALGVIRIVLEFGMRLNLREIFALALELYGDRPWKTPPAETVEKLLDFVAGRLRRFWQGAGRDTLLVDAALGAGADDILQAGLRLSALEGFVALPDHAVAVRTFKRVANIVRKQGAAETTSETWDASLLKEEPERRMADMLAALLPKLDDMAANGDYASALKALLDIRPAVDAFFDGVMVMCEDASLRRNRLAMLNALGARFARLADFAALQI